MKHLRYYIRTSSGFRETAARIIADMLPRKIVYFAVIRAWAYATTGRYGKDEAPAQLTADTVKRWGDQ